MTINETAAGNIRAEAARRGMTQSDVARRLGVAQSTINRRWRGHQAWTLELIEEVASIYRMDPIDLLRARRDSNPQPSDPEDAQPMLDLNEPGDTARHDREELPAAA